MLLANGIGQVAASRGVSVPRRAPIHAPYEIHFMVHTYPILELSMLPDLLPKANEGGVGMPA